MKVLQNCDIENGNKRRTTLTRPRPRKQRGSLSLNSLVENAVRMSGGGRAKTNTTTSEQTVSEDFSATCVKLNF